MLYDYGRFGLDELWNNKRFVSYLQAGYGDPSVNVSCNICENLPLAGGPYVSPQTDEAPWYDASYPESGEACGIFVQEVAGFDTLGSKDVTATPFGSVSSRRNLEPKTLTVTAVLSGKDCMSTQYLYRWLVARLMGRNCGTGEEEISTLAMYDCCPLDVGLSDEEIDNEYLRYMYRVSVVQDPTIIDRLGNCCGDGCGDTTLVVQWTFLLENPKLYRQTQLVVDEEVWPTDVDCIEFNCDPCPAEATVEVERTYQKTRYPVSVSVDGTWCPVGDWEPSDYFDNPIFGYLDIVNINTESTALQISVSYLGTWSVVGDWDPTDINLCNVNIEIVQAIQGGSVPAVPATTVPIGNNKRILPVNLTTTSSSGGTWSPQGWSHNTSASVAFPPVYSELKVFTDCGCNFGDGGCEIVLNEDGTWEPFEFTYVGILPPYGCDTMSVRRSRAGTYTVLEEVPISEAFRGCNISAVTPPDPFAGLASCYCQPLEWVQYAAQIDFSSPIETAQPYLEFFAGDAPLYNFRADFYTLPSDNVSWVTDGVLTEDLSCVEPDFSIRVGKSIPANSTYIYKPQSNSILLSYENVLYDYSASTSGVNGSSPYFFEFPECYGVVVVVTAEVHNGEVPSDTGTISLGYAPFVYVGV